MAAEPRIVRPVHLANPARAERSEDLVGAEASAGCQGHGGRNYRAARSLCPRSGGVAPIIYGARGVADGKATGSLLEFAFLLALESSAS